VRGARAAAEQEEWVVVGVVVVAPPRRRFGATSPLVGGGVVSVVLASPKVELIRGDRKPQLPVEAVVVKGRRAGVRVGRSAEGKARADAG
jgi:hypothetical protein